MNKLLHHLKNITDNLLAIELILEEKENETCTTSKKSEQQQTKKLPSFLKAPISPKVHEEEDLEE